MANQPDKSTRKETGDKGLQPDSETLHTTDPQDNMKGPVSSAMQGINNEAQKNNTESKEEADRKREENT